MSPRPRTVSDEAIVAGLGRVLGRVGPARLTLALIAREVGLAPATLLQRFGSKRNLLIQFSKGAGDVGPFLARFRQDGLSPLAAVKETLLCFAFMAPDPETFTNHLSSYLQLDLADPVLRGFVAQSNRRNERLYRRVLDEAVAAGELVAVDTKALARMLANLVAGSLIGWASSGTGPARAWLDRDLEVVLGPLRQVRAERSSRKWSRGSSARRPRGG